MLSPIALWLYRACGTRAYYSYSMQAIFSKAHLNVLRVHEYVLHQLIERSRLLVLILLGRSIILHQQASKL